MILQNEPNAVKKVEAQIFHPQPRNWGYLIVVTRCNVETGLRLTLMGSRAMLRTV